MNREDLVKSLHVLRDALSSDSLRQRLLSESEGDVERIRAMIVETKKQAIDSAELRVSPSELTTGLRQYVDDSEVMELFSSLVSAEKSLLTSTAAHFGKTGPQSGTASGKPTSTDAAAAAADHSCDHAHGDHCDHHHHQQHGEHTPARSHVAEGVGRAATLMRRPGFMDAVAALSADDQQAMQHLQDSARTHGAGAVTLAMKERMIEIQQRIAAHMRAAGHDTSMIPTPALRR